MRPFQLYPLTRGTKSALSGVGTGVLDCFVGERVLGLLRLLSAPVWSQIAWAELHVAMVHALRIRAVTDFLREVASTRAEVDVLPHRVEWQPRHVRRPCIPRTSNSGLERRM